VSLGISNGSCGVIFVVISDFLEDFNEGLLVVNGSDQTQMSDAEV
jgi:hypothetical protein